jgi:hypothetical protein
LKTFQSAAKDARDSDTLQEASPDPSRETPRSEGPTADPGRPDAGPSDSELERGILTAVRLGLGDVARTLSAQLEERRTGRGGNVIQLPARRAT